MSNSSQSVKKVTKTGNSQLKELKNQTQLDQLSKKLGSPYILTVFALSKPNEVYRCKVCPKSGDIEYKNLKRHILECETHERCLNGRDKEKHRELVLKIRNTKKEYKKTSINQENPRIKEGYLKFMAVCYKANLSFQQIQKIGLALKDIYTENDIHFLAQSSFSLDEISQTSNCWGDYLREVLRKDLEQSTYSLCIDNSTISGTNISAIQVRYLKAITLNEGSNEFRNLQIQNKVVGLKYLSDSSTGKTLYNIVQEKLFDLSPQIKNNLTGFTHDHASSLSGKGLGLYGHLLKDFGNNKIFNIEDPCHSLNLAVHKALKSLDDDVISFIQKIHSHFAYPQRKAFLAQIQKAENMPQLNLCHYVETRWLSLGLSLKRLLKIWPSLIKYMEKPQTLSIKKKDKTAFSKKLKDEGFKLTILFLSGVLEKVNSINTKLQNQTLEIDKLPQLIKKVIMDIAEIVFKEEKIPKDIAELKSIDWKEDTTFFKEDQDLLKAIYLELRDKSFTEFIENNPNSSNEVIETFRRFLYNLLENLLLYLPIEDKLLQSLSFLSLDGNKNDIKNNILIFTKAFNIIPEDKEKVIIEELNELLNEPITWIRQASKGSSLCLWNLIENSFNQIEPSTREIIIRFPCLSRIFRIAHSLAPSSANVEQCFSILKLLKSDIRNKINEKTLESLILIREEFKDDTPIVITERLIEIYNEMKKKLNQSKSFSRTTSQEASKYQSKSEVENMPNEEEKHNEEKESNEEEKLKREEQNCEEEINQNPDSFLEEISKQLEESLIMETDGNLTEINELEQNLRKRKQDLISKTETMEFNYQPILKMFKQKKL